MASTFTTNIGIEKPATGDKAGTWGTMSNTNMDLIDEATNGVVDITLAATGSSGSPNDLPITNGTSSNGRNKYIEFKDGGDLGGTVFVQLTPNDAEKVVFVRNSLSGSRSILIFQGTYDAARDVELLAGKDYILKFPGSGSSSTVINVLENIAIANDLSLVSDSGKIDFGADSEISLAHVADSGLQINIDKADGNAAPVLILNRTTDSPADDDVGGQIEFKMENDNNEQVDFGKIFTTALDVSDSTEDGKLTLQTITAGAAVNSIETTGTATTLNTITDDANAGPILNLKRTRGSGTAANNDIGGQIEFLMNDASGNETTVGRIKSKLTTAANGSEDSKVIFASTNGGTTTDVFTVSGEGTENAVFPETDATFELGVGGTNKSVHGNDILGGGANRLWKQVNALRMYLGNSGNTEASGANLFIDGSTNHIILSSSVGVGGGTINLMAFRARGTGTTVGSISSDATQTAFNTTSDYRLKENIVDISDGITRLKKLVPKRFNFKANSSQTVDGFLAHEVKAVVPNAVVGEKDAVDSSGNIDPQGMDQSKLVPLLTAALQEAIAKIEVLETKVAALEAK